MGSVAVATMPTSQINPCTRNSQRPPGSPREREITSQHSAFRATNVHTIHAIAEIIAFEVERLLPKSNASCFAAGKRNSCFTQMGAVRLHGKEAMTQKDAEKIVHEYALVLVDEKNGPASCESRLPHSPKKIIQAMKFWLAYEIQHHSLTQKFRNEIGSAACRLPYFIEDREAHRLNAISSNFSASNRADLPAHELRAKAMGEVHQWAINAAMAGSSVRHALTHFIATVEQFDPNDPQYYQRVCALAELPQ